MLVLEDKNGNWKEHNFYIALLILFFTNRKDMVSWLWSNKLFVRNRKMRIPFHCEGVDIS